MSNRHRLSYAAAGGCLIGFLTLWPAVCIGQDNNQPRRKPEQAQSTNERPHLIIVLPYFTDLAKIYQADADQRAAESQEQRDKDDLIAQQRMAVASDNMVDVGWGEVGIAFLALIISAAAAYFAGRALAVTRRGERAWLTGIAPLFATIKDCMIPDPTNGPGAMKYVRSGIMFHVQWKNTGRSSALKTNFFADHAICGRDDPIPRFNARFDRLGETGSALPNDASTYAQQIFLDDEQAASFRNQQSAIIIYAQAAYFDIYGGVLKKNIRYSEVTFRATHGGGSMTNPQGQTSEAIYFELVGDQHEMT